MRIKPRYRILLLALAGCLLLSGVGLLWYRADWRFRAANALRIYPRPALEALDPSQMQSLSPEDAAQLALRESYLLMLINGEHPIPKDLRVLLQEYNGAQMHPLMIESYVALRDAIEEKTGQRIYVSSDYRSPEEQEEILQSSPEGIAAQVGESEHEAGLALDIYVKGFGGMSLIKTEAGRELARICSDYGFIIRYPDGKRSVTGTPYEPWHLRYVGQPHASFISQHGLTLEEYVALLEVGVWYEMDEYYIGRFSSEELQIPKDCMLEGSFSPDNTGYYIVTLLKKSS